MKTFNPLIETGEIEGLIQPPPAQQTSNEDVSQPPAIVANGSNLPPDFEILVLPVDTVPIPTQEEDTINVINDLPLLTGGVRTSTGAGNTEVVKLSEVPITPTKEVVKNIKDNISNNNTFKIIAAVIILIIIGAIIAK